MDRLQRFVTDLLEREGALAEPIDPDGLEVLAPPHLQRSMRLPEICRLGFGAGTPDGAQRVGIDADWLERFAGAIGERGRWTRRVLCPDNPPLSGAERMLEHDLQIGNAPFRLIGAGPAWTRYLIFDFRFTARSDEQREGALRLGLNLATGASLDGVLDRLAPCLAEGGPDAALPDGVQLPPSWNREPVLKFIDRAVRPRLERLLEPFIKSLRRRLLRDQQRLHDFHNDLHREAIRRMAALPNGHEGHRREQQRIAAIAAEYRAKIDDLGHKYAMRVTVEWVQTLDLVMPVQRLQVLVRRRKGERVIELDWNPIARRLESPRCEFNHGIERQRLACDEALHLVSPAGLGPCRGCGKPYCRACHRERCPKCGQTTDPATLAAQATTMQGTAEWHPFAASSAR